MLEDALQDLNDADRAAVLLRYYEGRSFGDVGAGLGLNENAARMRVDRAVEKLRRTLARRGVTSSAAALGSALAAQTVAAAPAAWAATVAPTALGAAAGGAGVLAGWGLFAMNKVTIALLSGIAAAGLTTAVLTWKTRWTREEMAVLRADNEALRQLKQAHAASPVGEGASLAELADAQKLQQLATALSQRNQQAETEAANRRAATGSPKPVLQNRGMGAPAEALETFTWACYTGDLAAIARQIHFDGNGRQMAEAMLARMPANLRAQCRTPEDLYAFFTAADCLVYPPPSDPELLKKAQVVHLKPDRIALRRPGATSGGQEFQWTQAGWKRAYPEQAIEDLANQVLRTNPLPEIEDTAP